MKKAKSKKKDWALKLIKDVWPNERNFFERPERFRYVRKLIADTNCVFCTAEGADPSFDSLVLTKDKHCVVMMNKYPYNTGHLLITPRIHEGELWNLPDQVNASVGVWVKRCVGILKDEMKCQGFNIGLNHGAVAGAGLPDHLHWHIVPRWGGDTNFFPLFAETKVLPETLEQTYARLEKHFRELK